MGFYKNNTGEVSRIGYTCKQDSKDPSAIVYTTAGDSDILGIITQAVPKYTQCEVATTGQAKVFCSDNVVQGSVIRAAKSSDHISRATCKLVRPSDINYFKIGTALESGKGLIKVLLNLAYIITSSGSAPTDHGSLTGLADNDHPQYALIADTLVSEFETISKNLRTYPYTLTYGVDGISIIVYDLGGGLSITKTFNYTLSVLTSIVLSGDTPAGISLTKTFHYTGDDLTSVTYS